MTITIEDLIKLSSMVGIPIVLGVVWLVTSLVRTQTILAQLVERMISMEASMHKLRNMLTAITIDVGRRPHKDDSEQG